MNCAVFFVTIEDRLDLLWSANPASFVQLKIRCVTVRLVVTMSSFASSLTICADALPCCHSHSYYPLSCYIAQLVMGLGRVNWLHCWCVCTSGSNSEVCNSVTPLPYPDVTWFSVVLCVGSELLLFVNSRTTPTWSSYVIAWRRSSTASLHVSHAHPTMPQLQQGAT